MLRSARSAITGGSQILRGRQVEPQWHLRRPGARNAQTIVSVMCLEPFLTPPLPLQPSLHHPTRRRRPQW